MDSPDTVRAPVALTLSADEALVLFECLARAEPDGVLAGLLPAERFVLDQLEAQLERTLLAPFDPHYGDLVAAARERLVPHT